ncbi:hypothetical protein N7456_007374 [Penicillium angulare]|uniref:Uncharacterized protein n=1 Tax=Penicillium angulare TaxID=116970 RepID=A0A9W9FAI9_9EURO|nr:hypothetical protein N7456_007374 [Penicillium angulare]
MQTTYNDADERNARISEWWYNRTVLGTSLWAIDLDAFVAELPDGTVAEPPKLVNCDQAFTSLDDVEAAADSIDDECMNMYLIQALHGNLTSSLTAYHDVMKTHYDQKFGWYKDAVRLQFPRNLASFLSTNSSKYFTCTFTGLDRETHQPWGPNDTAPCPSDAESTSYEKYWWTAKDKDAFLADLEETTGITSGQLSWEENETHCSGVSTCRGSIDIGKPTLKKDFPVGNPKEIISARLPNITTFQDQSDTLLSLASADLYTGNLTDVVDGASVMVLMISNSITSMKSVEKVGSEYHKDVVENAIMLFVMSIILLIPGLGEIADELDFAALAVTLRAIGVTGDAGLGVYGIVSAKGEGVGEIFLAVLGSLGILDMLEAPSLFAKAAKARRGMSAEDIAALGDEVKGGMAQVDKLKKLCF